jgi:hypothetical protein
MSIFFYQNLNLKTPIEVLIGENKPRDNGRPRRENNKHRIIGGSLNKGEYKETHEIGRRKFFENILEPSKSIFFKRGPLIWGGGGGHVYKKFLILT